VAAPQVTVVAATHNRSALLPRLVRALEAQEGAPPFEVVIANDASSDDTVAVLDRLIAESTLTMSAIHHERRRGPGPGRNAAYRRGQGRLVLFTDDDCVPRPHWVARLSAALGEHDVVQGATVPAPDQLANTGTFSRTLEVREATGFFQTCNMGYRREVLDAADGFDERFDQPAGEDTDLALRCLDRGASFAFVGDAVVEHDVRPSNLWVTLKDTWRWQGVVGTVAKHPDLRVRLASSRWFWKPSHPRVLAAAAGVLAGSAGIATRQPLLVAAGAAVTAPYLRYRLLVDPIDRSMVGRVRYLGHAFLVDAAEVAALGRGSIKYRTLFL
jgi:glycosyltransferase involved in cell wall biosynthesis